MERAGSKISGSMISSSPLQAKQSRFNGCGGGALSGSAGRNGPKRSPRLGWRQSALGPNTPHRDLFLSRYHCLYLDGVLIPVVDLLNKSTITRCSAEDLREIEYFHIKLERHSVIYAEGAACETLRAVTAVNSDNVEFEEYRRLYGEPSLPDEPAAPMLGYNGGRSRLRGRIRSVVSHVIDVRSKLEIVRDDLKERARSVGHDSR